MVFSANKSAQARAAGGLRWLGLLVGLLAGAVAAANQTPSAPVDVSRLDNGMTLIIQPDRRAPTVVHMVWLRVGAMDEVDGSSGVAHVLEHMMFKGTPSVPAGEFSRRVAALGGRDNAFTNMDYTGYYQQVPAQHLGEVMRLEADRFAHNAWSDEEFRKELEVVKEERRLRTDDNPQARLAEALHATAFAVSPYRRPVIGWMSDLESLTPEDARAFHKRWYVPGNAAVVVVGDVDVDQVKALAQATYGRIPAAVVPPRKPQPEPPQAGIKRLTLKAPAQQAVVRLAFKVPGVRWVDGRLGDGPDDQDALALTVLAAVLDGYNGARLERALTQGESPLATSAAAFNGLWGRGPQLFSLMGIPARGQSADALERALREEVARIAREGISERELQRVKAQWLAAEVYKRDSLFNQARELGMHWVLGAPPDAAEQLIQRLRGVTAAQVQRVAQRWFGDDQLTVAHLLPQPLATGRGRPAAVAGLRHDASAQP